MGRANIGTAGGFWAFVWFYYHSARPGSQDMYEESPGGERPANV